MKYHELLELYRKKELGEEERAMVEQDIERHEAISEYLFEKEETEGLGFTGEILSGEGNPGETGRRTSADEFTRRVNRAVRRAFLKMGAAVCALTLTAVLLILFVLPRAVAGFYYNPGKTAGEGSYTVTNQMSLDLAVYTELAMPASYRDQVLAEDRGYGNYDITIYQSVSRNQVLSNVAGRIEQGTLRLYDINQLKLPVSNIFGWFQMDLDQEGTLTAQAEHSQNSFYAAGDRAQQEEELMGLEENKTYLAYVTLDQLMDYDTFTAFTEMYSDRIGDLWCVPRTMAESYQRTGRPVNLGFYTMLGQSSSVEWDREKYPDLVLWSTGEDPDGWDQARERIKEEAFAKEHFAVMLEYMSEQQEFLGMMGQSGEVFAEAADYVRENGLEVYGFACTADRETLLELFADRMVYGIDTQEID